MSEWQTIETAPKDGTYIIACHFSDGVLRAVPTVIIFDEIVGWSGRTAHDEKLLVKIAPTHWMPLPPPPQEDTE